MRVSFVYLNEPADKITARGAGYVAATIQRAGHPLDFYDTAYDSLEDVASRAAESDVLMMSATTMLFQNAVKLAQLVKARCGVPVLLGGVHCTVLPEQVLQGCPEIDYLCVGEGEDFSLEFLEKLGTPGLFSVQNLAHRDPDGKIVVNSIRPCTDLAGLPRFPYELFRASSVVQAGPLPGFCYVAATRGCPYSCAYCDNSYYLGLYGKNYLRRMPLDAVMEDLRHLVEHYPAKTLFFGDEMILFDEDYCVELFTRLRREIDLPYGCMARVEKINPRIVEVFRDTGCRYVGMGIECGDEQFRREFLRRGMTDDQIVGAFRLLREGVPGITLTSYNMKGYPVPDDAELTEKTLALNRRIQPDIMQVSVLYPFPGTRIYDHCLEQGLIDPEKAAEDWFSGSVFRGVDAEGYAAWLKKP